MLENTDNVREHLLPMIKDALDRLSFGLVIIHWDVVFLQQINMENYSGPAFAAYYVTRGAVLGEKNNIGNMTVFANPSVLQEAVDEGIRMGCDFLRAEKNKQLEKGNGIPFGKTLRLPNEN